MHTIQTDRLIGFSDLSIESGLLKAVYPESYEPDIFGGSSGLTGRESQFQFYTKNNLNDEVCHIIVMWKREKRPEVSYGTNDPYRGNKYMEEALTGFLEWVQNNTDEKEIWGLPNGEYKSTSQHILEKCGFKPSDKHASDLIWYVFQCNQ